MLWFEVFAEMPPAMTSQVKMLTYFMTSPVITIGMWVALLVIAALMVVGMLTYNHYKRESQYERTH